MTRRKSVIKKKKKKLGDYNKILNKMFCLAIHLANLEEE